MLIGIDASRALLARRTGTENYSLQLIRHLLALDSGHRFRLYCNVPPPPGLFQLPIARQDERPGLAARTTPRHPSAELRVIPFPRLWTHVRLSAEVGRHPPDLLFVPSHVLPLLHPRRSVVTVHDLGYRFFPQAHGSWDRRYLDLSTRWSARRARHLLADSAATRDDLVAAYGVDAGKISVVHLGRDENLQRVEDQERIRQVAERYDISGPYFLFVGTLQPRKNLERLVEAFAHLLNSHSREAEGLTLVLAGGRGWLADGIFRRVEALGLAGRVRFPGFVADEDLAALLSGATAFLFPSLYEGFGLPVLEAQACGLPVLAANTSSLPEVAGEGALLVDPLDVDALAEGLARLLTDPDLRRRLVRAGHENVARFSWRRCAAETLAVLEAVAGGSD